MKRKHNFWKRADVRIRRYCRKLTQWQRMTFVMIAFALLLAGCLYMIITALSGLGKANGNWEIEHIRPPEQIFDNSKNNEPHHFKDFYDYGHPENKDTVRLLG